MFPVERTMKRGRNDPRYFHRYGPAAAALRRGHVFRDAREAKKQVKVQDILRDAVEMQQFHSAAAGPRSARGKEGGGLAGASSSSSEAVLLHNREELALYRQKKRAELEVKVTRGRQALGNWVKYARWEAEQQNFTRMRSVLERALEIHGLEASLWRDYAELEASNGFVKEARQVYGRAVQLLPAAVDLWLKYVLLELAAGRETLAREVFLKWTQTTSVEPPSWAFELQVLLEVAIHPPLSRSGEDADRRRGLPAVGSSERGGEASVSGTLSIGATPSSSPSSASSTALTIVSSSPPPSSSPVALYTGGGLHFPLPSAGREPLPEVCRKILRRFVEAVNTTDSWLFYALVESVVLLDPGREIKVLQTAMQVLPPGVLYGPLECRIPLALADAYCRMGDIEGARRRYQELLDRVIDQKHTDLVLQHYRRFERLHAETVEVGEYVSFLQAKKKYERKFAAFFCRSQEKALARRGAEDEEEEERDKAKEKKKRREKKGEEEDVQDTEASSNATSSSISFDYDGALSLYVLLHQQAARQRRAAKETASSNPKGVECRELEEEKQALRILRQAVTVLPSSSEPLARFQQHAVLVSAFAKHVLQRHRAAQERKETSEMSAVAAEEGEEEMMVLAQEARAALEATMQQFPFHGASCTALWLDAATLEEEVFHHEDQARRLLQRGFEVTTEMGVFHAWLALERRAWEQAKVAILHQTQAQEEESRRKRKPQEKDDHGACGEGDEDCEEEEEEKRRRRWSTLATEHLQRMQQAFQSAIKAAPFDASRWHLYAKWEEQQAFSSTTTSSMEGEEDAAARQTHRLRAATLYQHCIATLTAEARKRSLSLAERYTLLQSADESWAKLMALERRALRKSLREVQRLIGTSSHSFSLSSGIPPVLVETLKENAERFHRVSVQLLEDVAGGYHLEALAWALAYQQKSGTGVLSVFPPTSLPDSLNPAIVRFVEACDAVMQCLSREVAPALAFYQQLVSQTAEAGSMPSSSPPATSTTGSGTMAGSEEMGKRLIRETFQSLLTTERKELYRALMAGKEGSFEEAKIGKTWREALLGPILTQWAKYEAAVGGNLEAVGAAAASGLSDGAIPPSGGPTVARRRTRLFKKG